LSDRASDAGERALLAERMLAEQEERRRVAELLHDGPIQQLSAISQMLDAGLAELESGSAERAAEVFARGLELSRDAARDLRQLCDDLEPRVLHTLGFAAAVTALARRIAGRSDVEIDVDVEGAAGGLGENAAVALYQIVREATEQAVRRGTLTRVEISLLHSEGGGIELVVADDGPPERRAAVLEALAERAATLNGRFSSEVRYPRGSTLRIDLPPAAAHR
jgi:two-component system NarL family sensor kinase